MNCAIVGLVRGYSGQKSKYESLIVRNNSIQKHINKDNKYKMILFHEDNFIDEDKKYVEESCDLNLEFVNISYIFKLYNKELLKQVKDLDRFGVGYRMMCRFNSYYIWDLVSKFDYILRVDEDIEILNIENNFFENMNKENAVFLTGKFISETHQFTNETLPDQIKFETKSNNLNFYNHAFPYTNVYASKVDFWLQDNLNSQLKNISTSDFQFINRWGDLPILGCFLNIYSDKNSFKKFRNLTYIHGSHGKKVDSKKTNIFR